MNDIAASRLSRFGTSCLHRAPAALAFGCAIAFAPLAAHGADTPSVSNDAKPSAATKEGLAALKKRFNMAYDLVYGSRLAQGEREMRDILSIYERDLGPEHPETLACRYAVAGFVLMQNRLAEAESEYRAILGIRERLMGVDHPDTLITSCALAKCLAMQNKTPEALRFARRALDGLSKAPDKVSKFAKQAKKLVEELEQLQKKK
ncbi:MAG: tetratricopeptide repeat protein [Verrucomicrobia bacterium]|nr:tetratricopeptide repeat protein [Verrucomicrobiota bacterium]